MLSAPVSPPTQECLRPYSWDPCTDRSSCIYIYCTATWFGLTQKVYGASCVLTLDQALALFKTQEIDAACTQSPGIFQEGSFPMEHNLTTSPDNSIPSTSIVSTESTSKVTNVSNTPNSTFEISDISPGPGSPASPAPTLSPFSAISTKQRRWLGPVPYFENPPPKPRYGHGFTSADGKLYVFGGSAPVAGQNNVHNQGRANILVKGLTPGLPLMFIFLILNTIENRFILMLHVRFNLMLHVQNISTTCTSLIPTLQLG